MKINEAICQYKDTEPCNYDDVAPQGRSYTTTHCVQATIPAKSKEELPLGGTAAMASCVLDRCGHAVPRIGRLNSDIKSAQDNRARVRGSNPAAKRTRRELTDLINGLKDQLRLVSSDASASQPCRCSQATFVLDGFSVLCGLCASCPFLRNAEAHR